MGNKNASLSVPVNFIALICFYVASVGVFLFGVVRILLTVDAIIQSYQANTVAQQSDFFSFEENVDSSFAPVLPVAEPLSVQEISQPFAALVFWFAVPLCAFSLLNYCTGGSKSQENQIEESGKVIVLNLR